jgi:hypothetical protein
MNEYVIVEEYNSTELEQAINFQAQRGYECDGPVVVDNEYQTLIQRMKLKEDIKK